MGFTRLRFKIVTPCVSRIVVKLRGELTSGNLSRLGKEVPKAMKAAGPDAKGGVLAFECSEATYADSQGISLLLQFTELARRHHLKTEIQNPHKDFRTILKRLKVDPMFKFIE